MRSKDDRPHLLRVYIDASWPETPRYVLECPYVADEVPGSCAVWEECDVHPLPAQPRENEPGLKPYGAGSPFPSYVDDADPVAVQAWKEYHEDHERWDDLHDGTRDGDTGYHLAPGTCWAAHMIEEFGPDDGWRFDESLDKTEIVSPLPVDCYNDGQVDEPLLVLTRWDPK